MLTKVQTTSIQAYHQTAQERETWRGKIAEYILRHQDGVTIEQVARVFHIDKSSASGRMNELKKEGYFKDARHYKMQVIGRRKSKTTGRTADVWVLR